MSVTEPNILLYGHEPTERIVAVERVSGDRMRVFRREPDDRVVSTLVDFSPWLVTTDAAAAEVGAAAASVHQLAGGLPLRQRLTFRTWSQARDAVARLRDRQHHVQFLANPVDQYLTLSGRTLFKGMDFDDILRLQLDIETAGINARDPESAVLLVALSTNRGHREILRVDELGEAQTLSVLAERIQQIDPDVIEGHNLFNFDLPFLLERARRHRVTLGLGRDGSPPRPIGTQRFKAGPRSIPYQAVSIFGRHVVDTYQQIQRYDASGELQSYGLKESVDALGLTREGRTFIPGSEVARVFRQDPERVISYALDDVDDVALLSSLCLPTEFYQTQILPRNFQNVATGGPGEKINYLMTRVYLSLDHSLPVPSSPKPYPGGYSEVRRVGVFKPVIKCDVESLYPAIMLTDRIAPATDHLNVYLELLQVLTQRRLEAKRRLRETEGAERARWMGLQLSFKVLINSFYGYLGYSRALFNDFDAARRVTLRGQEIIRQVVAELEAAGAETIEIDTDGVYFRPPPGIAGSLEREEQFIDAIGDCLPPGISLAHDGSFQGMLSLKTKNYALMSLDGRIILKGSSLRSRREEVVLRRFLREATNLLIRESTASARNLYLDVADDLIHRRLPITEISRWETITDKTFSSEANRRLAEAAEGERIGERIAVYQRTDGALARIEDYARDEDVDYLLRRLRDMAERFRPLLPDDTTFDYYFPPLTSRTDISEVRHAAPVQQLSMF